MVGLYCIQVVVVVSCNCRVILATSNRDAMAHHDDEG